MLTISFCKTEVLLFVGTDGGAPPSENEGLPFLLIGVGAIVIAAISGFVVWARRPAEDSWDDADTWD